MSQSTVSWSPSLDFIKGTQSTAFLEHLKKTESVSLESHDALHTWSIQNTERFWKAVWTFCDVKGNRGPGPFLINEEDTQCATFFPTSTLNFAENLLRKRTNETAIVFWGEDKVKRSLTFSDLHDQVSRLVQVLKKMGVKKGDRVAGLVPNTPEAIIAMLATATLGGIWASCSPDFGVPGILDRFKQIEPKILFVADYYLYRGKQHKILEKLQATQKELPSLHETILFSYAGEKTIRALPKTKVLSTLIESYTYQPIEFERFPFNTPLFIMFSSGTTGAPKCIVHSAGGTLLQHMKEHQLHCNIQPNDRVFYFTTCGWMMWHWQVSSLASGATLLLYEGSPFWPNPHILFDYAEQEKMTLFGVSAKYISALQKAEVSPKTTHNISALKVMTSTGSPLAPEEFDYVYDHIKKDLILASISGGTDIISCFVLGTPLKSVHRGEIQTAGLGMDVQVFNDAGAPVIGEKGELVCINPFPSRPLGFWNDPDNSKYHAAYFDKFKNVWCHGDFIEKTKHNGFIIHGRSDAVLNRGGVRIGTSEIYRQVEKIENILESIVVGQPYQGDIRVILFVKMKQGHKLDDDLVQKIKKQIRAHTTPRHVPDLIIQAPDIPRTKNGKIVELAVSSIIQGLPIKNKEALDNPEVLKFFANLEELKGG
jgi:acetoacetyl-CoA synthetase